VSFRLATYIEKLIKERFDAELMQEQQSSISVLSETSQNEKRQTSMSESAPVEDHLIGETECETRLD
jgi:hypothetical protein